MYFHWIDWIVVSAVVLFMIWIGYYSKRYTRGVADFLAANRLAGKYLLTVSTGMTGTIGMIATWQMIFNAGLSTQWWEMMAAPVGLLISLTGFIIYRFRETRALTLAQFFEIRYSRRFRFFAGGLSWLSGLLNYGVFPAVTARLIITFLGLPDNFDLLEMQVSTFPSIMIAYLSVAVFIACSGGQISIMISDFFQEFICKLILISIVFFLLYHYSWDNIITGLQQAPEGQSMLNPFKIERVRSN
jgi:SSS family solute:Na+ symporter